jgi:imidazolonepropionase-like amidohydrolase
MRRVVSARWLRIAGVAWGSAALASGRHAAPEDGAVSAVAEREARGLRPIEAAPAWPTVETLLDHGTVLTADGARYEDGWVLLRDGRIAAVGDGPRPSAALVLDVAGKFVTPGLIDTHSHLGVYPSPSANAHEDGNEMVGPTTAGVWAEHAVWPQDPGFQRAVAGGITALQILPGSGNLIGGRGVTLRPLPARGARAMRFVGAPETVKMACGENPKRVYGERGGPMTRMGNVAGQREAFIEARAYLEALEASEAAPSGGRRHAEPPPDPPEQDLALDTLAGLLRGDVLAQVHCYRADDMLSFLQMADEFGFAVRSFHHAVEAYKIRDILAERGVAVSTWSDWWGFKMEAFDAVLPQIAMLSSAQVRAVVHSDSAIGVQRLNQEAGKAWYDGQEAGFGVSEDAALRWITAEPAWVLGIDDQTGTLTPGKRADVVVWSHHPFSLYAKAERVFIDGAQVFALGDERVWSDFLRGQGLAAQGVTP